MVSLVPSGTLLVRMAPTGMLWVQVACQRPKGTQTTPQVLCMSHTGRAVRAQGCRVSHGTSPLQDFLGLLCAASPEPCVQSSHKAAPKVTAQTMPAAGASSILQPYKKQQQNPTKLLSRTGSISHYICLPFGSTAGSQQRLTAPSLPANMPPFK